MLAKVCIAYNKYIGNDHVITLMWATENINCKLRRPPLHCYSKLFFKYNRPLPESQRHCRGLASGGMYCCAINFKRHVKRFNSQSGVLTSFTTFKKKKEREASCRAHSLIETSADCSATAFDVVHNICSGCTRTRRMSSFCFFLSFTFNSLSCVIRGGEGGIILGNSDKWKGENSVLSPTVRFVQKHSVIKLTSR